MTPRLSGHFSIFGLVFLSSSLFWELRDNGTWKIGNIVPGIILEFQYIESGLLARAKRTMDDANFTDNGFIQHHGGFDTSCQGRMLWHPLQMLPPKDKTHDFKKGYCILYLFKDNIKVEWRLLAFNTLQTKQTNSNNYNWAIHGVTLFNCSYISY